MSATSTECLAQAIKQPDGSELRRVLLQAATEIEMLTRQLDATRPRPADMASEVTV